MIERAEHLVEIHPAVKESPGDIAHERAQEVADVQRVAHRPAIAGPPGDVGEVFVAPEAEASQREDLIPVRLFRLRFGGSRHGPLCIHVRLLNQCIWQISVQRSIDKAPLQVCRTITAGWAPRN